MCTTENGKFVGEPLFYWECVMSDSFAETVENMFYLSFLLKLKVIVCWVSLILFELAVFKRVSRTTYHLTYYRSLPTITLS